MRRPGSPARGLPPWVAAPLASLARLRPGRALLPEQWRGLALLLHLGFLGLSLATFSDYGVTYDEEWNATYGRHVAAWWASGFADRSALEYWNLFHYGAFADVVLNGFAALAPFGLYEARHLGTAFFGLLGLAGAWRAGVLLSGPRAGLLAALLLALAPRWYGDAFQNFKDVPFAALGTWFLVIVLRWLPHVPRVPWRMVAALGTVTGLALGIRIGGLLFFAYLVLGTGAALLLSHMHRGRRGADAAWPAARTLGLRWVAAGVAAYAVMLPWWPAAQVRPLRQPVESLWFAANFQLTFPVFFEGARISSSDLPWYYLPKWFLVTLPEAHLLALAAAVALLPTALRREWTGAEAPRAVGVALVAFAALFPFAYTMVSRPTTYDGIRHFLFVLPPLCILGALALDALFARPSLRAPAVLAAAAVAGSLALTAADLVRLHPYQYTYFNRLLAGGFERASRAFETDYWGASYKEGVEWLVANHSPAPGESRPKVASCLHPRSTTYYLPEDRFEYVGSFDEGPPLAAEPDVLLATTRWGGHEWRRGRVLHAVERMGVPLLYVIEVEPGQGAGSR